MAKRVEVPRVLESVRGKNKQRTSGRTGKLDARDTHKGQALCGPARQKDDMEVDEGKGPEANPWFKLTELISSEGIQMTGLRSWLSGPLTLRRLTQNVPASRGWSPSL